MTDARRRIKIELSEVASVALSERSAMLGIPRSTVAKMLLTDALLRGPQVGPVGDWVGPAGPQGDPRETPGGAGDTLLRSSSLSSPPDPGSCVRGLSSEASGPTLADQGIDTQAVCSECRRLFLELRSVQIHPFDTDFDRAVVERLTGISLRADAGGPATPEQIYAVIREACSGYGRRQLYPATVIRGTSFWANYAKTSATEPESAKPRPKFTDAERQAFRMTLTEEQIDMLERGEEW